MPLYVLIFFGVGVRGVTAQLAPSTYIASTCDPATIRCAQPVHASDWVTARPFQLHSSADICHFSKNVIATS